MSFSTKFGRVLGSSSPKFIRRTHSSRQDPSLNLAETLVCKNSILGFQHKIWVRAGIELPQIYLTHALLKTGSIFKFGRNVGLQELNLVHWNAVEPSDQIQGNCPFFVTCMSHLRIHTVTANSVWWTYSALCGRSKRGGRSCARLLCCRVICAWASTAPCLCRDTDADTHRDPHTDSTH